MLLRDRDRHDIIDRIAEDDEDITADKKIDLADVGLNQSLADTRNIYALYI